MVYTIISAKNLRTELATSTIIGSQIVNLQLSLGIPWLISNILNGNLIFNDPTIFYSMFAIFLIVLPNRPYRNFYSDSDALYINEHRQ